ncbi:MAG: CRISPR-associated helicase/endonuclease Cas3 [Candidatus Abyssubacteria bacterium]
MPWYAHTPNPSGQWHDLEEHLRDTARLAKNLAHKFNAGAISYYLGLWHDLGKFHPRFQDYLKKCAESNSLQSRSIAHSPIGALFAWQQNFDLVALLVSGHHAGLSSPSRLKQQMSEVGENDQAKEALRIAVLNMPDISPSQPIKRVLNDAYSSARYTEFFLRMLFSTLVDADYLNTEAHFQHEKSEIRRVTPNLEDLWAKFETHQNTLIGSAPDTPVNRARLEIYRHCLATAENPQGIFRLTVPTGGGKTLSSLAFALKHALCHKLDRIVVAIPYTSIIEQNADVYRRAIGEELAVLEHHSAVSDVEDENPTPAQLRLRLASENWDFPIIVTTTVQLFESIFSNKTSRCRKLHNIARSVLILDEVQTLPVELLEPILDVLQILTDHYGVTIVLCTATQPAFEKESQYLKGLKNVTEVVPQPKRYFSDLKRVDYQIIRDPLTWQQVASEMMESNQCLTIVNTRKDALALLDALGDPNALHLSTLLCGAHRRDVLKEIRERLGLGAPCRVVSTQVVEAGVDLDFPLVLRAIGPLDRIVQAAGRCNREGALPTNGRVIVFNPAEGSIPRGPYRSGMDEARKILEREDTDLHDPEEFTRYFRLLYMDVSTDANKVQQARERFDFPDVAEKMQLIKDKTVPVIVRYEPHRNQVEKLLTQANCIGITKNLWRQLQAYTISLFEKDFRKHIENGLVKESAAGLNVWCGGYDSIRGVQTIARDPADLII